MGLRDELPSCPPEEHLRSGQERRGDSGGRAQEGVVYGRLPQGRQVRTGHLPPRHRAGPALIHVIGGNPFFIFN